MANGNSLFLVCVPCEQADEPDYGVLMAERSHIGWYEHRVPTKQFDAWLAKHRKCGGRNNPDHFALAHLRGRNADQLPDLNPITEAIRLNGSH
jgi:hypothetical protein